MTERLRGVVAIGGTGQSGSTLLCRMLGQLPGFAAVGEIGRLWDKGVLQNTECGCGQPFGECAFWRRVGDAAFGGWDAVDAARIVALRDRVQPIHRRAALPRMLPLLVWPRLSRPYAAACAEYAAITARVFDGVRAVTGAHTVVDSMKLPAHVSMLRALPDTDVRVVHNVRDPRGVAFSNLRRVPKVGGTRPLRGRRHPVHTAARWVAINTTFEVLERTGIPTKLVRYECVVADPREAVRDIARFAGVEPSDEDLAFIDGQVVTLPADHIVAGNRTRMRRGAVPLNHDEAWRSGLPATQQRLVTALTWPMRQRYARADGSAIADVIAHSATGRRTTPREPDRETAAPADSDPAG